MNTAKPFSETKTSDSPLRVDFDVELKGDAQKNFRETPNDEPFDWDVDDDNSKENFNRGEDLSMPRIVARVPLLNKSGQESSKTESLGRGICLYLSQRPYRMIRIFGIGVLGLGTLIGGSFFAGYRMSQALRPTPLVEGAPSVADLEMGQSDDQSDWDQLLANSSKSTQSIALFGEKKTMTQITDETIKSVSDEMVEKQPCYGRFNDEYSQNSIVMDYYSAGNPGSAASSNVAFPPANFPNEPSGSNVYLTGQGRDRVNDSQGNLGQTVGWQQGKTQDASTAVSASVSAATSASAAPGPSWNDLTVSSNELPSVPLSSPQDYQNGSYQNQIQRYSPEMASVSSYGTVAPQGIGQGSIRQAAAQTESSVAASQQMIFPVEYDSVGTWQGSSPSSVAPTLVSNEVILNNGAMPAANGYAQNNGAMSAANGYAQNNGAMPAANGHAQNNGAMSAANGYAQNNGTMPVGNGYAQNNGAMPAANGYAQNNGAMPAANGYAQNNGAMPAGNGYAQNNGAMPAANGYAQNNGVMPAANGYAQNNGAMPAGNGYAQNNGAMTTEGSNFVGYQTVSRKKLNRQLNSSAARSYQEPANYSSSDYGYQNNRW